MIHNKVAASRQNLYPFVTIK